MNVTAWFPLVMITLTVDCHMTTAGCGLRLQVLEVVVEPPPSDLFKNADSSVLRWTSMRGVPCRWTTATWSFQKHWALNFDKGSLVRLQASSYLLCYPIRRLSWVESAQLLLYASLAGLRAPYTIRACTSFSAAFHKATTAGDESWSEFNVDKVVLQWHVLTRAYAFFVDTSSSIQGLS